MWVPRVMFLLPIDFHPNLEHPGGRPTCRHAASPRPLPRRRAGAAVASACRRAAAAAACGGVLASNAGLCGGMLPPCYGSRDTGLAVRPSSSARLKRISMGVARGDGRRRRRIREALQFFFYLLIGQ